MWMSVYFLYDIESTLIHRDVLQYKLWNNGRTSPVEEYFWVQFSALQLEIILKNTLPQMMSDRYFKACSSV